MKVEKIYKINMIMSVIYFFVVLINTIIMSLFCNVDMVRFVARSIASFLVSLGMICISYRNLKNGKSFFDKKIKSRAVKTLVISYNVIILAACILNLYASVSEEYANVSFGLVSLVMVMFINEKQVIRKALWSFAGYKERFIEKLILKCSKIESIKIF